jgi:hypothetical protein
MTPVILCGRSPSGISRSLTYTFNRVLRASYHTSTSWGKCFNLSIVDHHDPLRILEADGRILSEHLDVDASLFAAQPSFFGQSMRAPPIFGLSGAGE